MSTPAGHPDDGGPTLTDTLLRAIRAADGALPFDRFMDLALYEPGYGYYAAGADRVGRHGDFITSVSAGPLFGRILARYFRSLRDAMGGPAEFGIVEFGGHRGQLRADVLGEAPELDYRVVEAGDPWPDAVTGCVFSNEFIDALPFHRVTVRDGVWQELCVTSAAPADPPFAWTLRPLSTPRLAEALRDLPAHLMEGHVAEICLRAPDWLAAVAVRLVRGYVVTVDYGFERHDYFAPHRRNGLLACYHRHERSDNPFLRVGRQDITAHVDFSSLMEQGRRVGLETVLFADQSRFLLDAGRELVEEIVARDAGRYSAERNAIHQLIHPAHMGLAFKVLVQRKV